MSFASNLASVTKMLISLVFPLIQKVYQILTFFRYWFLIKSEGKRETNEKNYFAKLVRYMKNLYHIESGLYKLSDERLIQLIV